MSHTIRDMPDKPSGSPDARAEAQDGARSSTDRAQGRRQEMAVRVRRFGQVLGIKPEHAEEYERLHRAVWPGVLATIHACNMRNYSIFRYENLLFGYFEYVGDDYEADMAKMAADPSTQEWWSICEPLQEPVPQHAPGEWWMALRELFHTD